MLDIKYIRENAAALQLLAKQKNIKVEILDIIKLDDQRRRLTTQVEELRTRKNRVSKQIPTMQESEKEKEKPKKLMGKGVFKHLSSFICRWNSYSILSRYSV